MMPTDLFSVVKNSIDSFFQTRTNYTATMKPNKLFATQNKCANILGTSNGLFAEQFIYCM